MSSIKALFIVHLALKKGITSALAVSLPARNDSAPLVEVSRSVNWAAKILPFTTCLSQAITCKARLNQYAYDSRFLIGLRKLNNNKLDAHAWVEDAEGNVLCPLRDISPFTVIDTDISALGDVQWS